MSWAIINTEEREYTLDQITTIVNQERKTNYTDLSIMIASLGIGVVTSSLFTRYVKDVRLKIQHVLGIVGIVVTIAGITSALEKNNDVDALQAVIDRARAYGGTISIITNTYEYTTGSGNHSTWKTETTYRYNRY